MDREERLCGVVRAGVYFVWRRVCLFSQLLDLSGGTSGINACVTSCFHTFRDGHYGLYLDESLFNGSSARCPTFDNEPLCSPGPMRAGMVPFECMGLEVWGVDPNS